MNKRLGKRYHAYSIKPFAVCVCTANCNTIDCWWEEAFKGTFDKSLYASNRYATTSGSVVNQ